MSLRKTRHIAMWRLVVSLVPVSASAQPCLWEQTPVPSPAGSVENQFHGIDGVAGDDVWAVGFSIYIIGSSREYQTLIARLTGLDVSNASLYDGGSAAAEAVLMAVSCTKRFGKVVTAESVHPEYRQTIATYLEHLGVELVTVATPGGVVNPADFAAAVDETTACIVIQQPNFFGCVEDACAASSASDPVRSSSRSRWTARRPPPSPTRI